MKKFLVGLLVTTTMVGGNTQKINNRYDVINDLIDQYEELEETYENNNIQYLNFIMEELLENIEVLYSYDNEEYCQIQMLNSSTSANKITQCLELYHSFIEIFGEDTTKCKECVVLIESYMSARINGEYGRNAMHDKIVEFKLSLTRGN